MTDIGSDISNALNGLQTIVADDIEVDSLEVSGLATVGGLNVSGNATIAQDLTVYGNYFGPAITSNTGTYAFLTAGTGSITNLTSTNFNFSNLSGPTGYIGSLTSNEIRTPLIYNPTGGYLTVGNSTSTDVVELKASTVQADGDFYIGRLNNRSRMIMNSNSAVGATGAGIYVRDDPGGGGVFTLAKMGVVSSDRLAYQYSTPANQKMTVEMRPKTVSVNTTSQILLSDPASSSQTINSDVQINGNLGVSGTISGSFASISANTGSFNYLSAGTGTISNFSSTTGTIDNLSSTTGSITSLSSTNITFSDTISGPTGSFSNLATDQIFFKPPLEPGVGNWTTLNRSDAKILYYDGGASNWGGEGVDAGGNWWRRTGVGTQHTMIQLESGGVGIDVLPSNMSSKLQVAGEVCTETGVGGYSYKDRTSGTKNFITLSDGDVLTTANYGVEPLTTLSRGPGDLWVKGKVSGASFTGATGSFTNLASTNGTITNLTSSTATINTLASTDLTVTNPQYQPIPGNLLTAHTHRAFSTITIEGYAESTDYVCAYGYLGCNGTAQQVQLFNLAGTLVDKYINIPTTATTNMPFAVLYSRSTGEIIKTWRLPYGTSGGTVCLGACFDISQRLYLVGYINNTTYGSPTYYVEGWDEQLSTTLMTSSSIQYSWCIGLDPADSGHGLVRAFYNTPNQAGAYFRKITAGAGDGEVFIAGAYYNTGGAFTVYSLTTIPASSSLSPYIVWITLLPALVVLNNVWYAGHTIASKNFYIKDILWLTRGTGELYMYMGWDSSSTLNFYDFGATQTTIKSTLPPGGSANWSVVMQWQKSGVSGMTFSGRAWIVSGNLPTDGSAGRMVYNPGNQQLYLTGTTTTWSETVADASYAKSNIDNANAIGEPLQNIRTGTASSQVGFLCAYNVASRDCVGIAPLGVENALFINRGESFTRLGAMYVDGDGNLYVYGRLQLSRFDQDTNVDFSINRSSTSPFIFRNSGDTSQFHNFFVKFDVNDKCVGYAPGITTDTSGAFQANGFCSWRSGTRLTIACANPVNTAEYTLFGFNFNNTYSGVSYQTGTSPTRAEGLVFAIKADSTTYIGSKGISIGWDAPLTNSANSTYQDFASSQLKVSGQITSATAITTPIVSSYNYTDPLPDNYRPTLLIQPEGGAVAICGDADPTHSGAKLTIGQGVPLSKIANTDRPFAPFGVGFSDCHYVWDGFIANIGTTSEQYNRITSPGAVGRNSSYLTSRWNQAFMIGLTNMTQDTTTFSLSYNPSIPTAYFNIRLPAYHKCDNAVFVQTLGRDRWTNLRAWLYNIRTGAPEVFLGEMSTNGGDASNQPRNASTLGPWNAHARGMWSTYHHWVQFNVPQRFLNNTDYVRSGEFYISIQNANGTTENITWVSGFAVAPNPYSINQRTAIQDVWRSFSLNSSIYLYTSWALYNEDTYVAYTTSGRSPFHYFCLPDYPTTSDWIYTVVLHGNTWESPQITLVAPTPFRGESQRFRRGPGPSYKGVQGAGIYRECFHVYISREVMNQNYAYTTKGAYFYKFQLGQEGSGIDVGVYIRAYAIERATPQLVSN